MLARVTSGALIATAVALSAASTLSASPRQSHWVAADFLRTVRQRYPAFVRVQPLRFGADGKLYWTARRPWSFASPRLYTDGTEQHVFAWLDGKTRDLGSLGQSDNHAVAINGLGQAAVTRSVGPFPSVPGGRLPKLPPSRAFLWSQGRFTSLGTLGGAEATATAINDRGEIAGSSEIKGSDLRSEHAFLWRDGTMIDLGTLGGRTSWAQAINDAGDVVGTSLTSNGEVHGFLWRAGTMTDLGTLGGRYSEAEGIDDRGVVVGRSTDARNPRGDMRRAFVWENGKMTDLGVDIALNWPALTVNERGQIVGVAGTTEAPRGFVSSEGKVAFIGALAGRQTIPTAISDTGVVAGGAVAARFDAHAFVWQDGKITPLPGPALPSTPVALVDRSGRRILGTSYETAGLRTRMLLWSRRR